MRNEEAINSTWNRISSLKVFHVPLNRRPSILQDIYVMYQIQQFVSELIEYACINTHKSRALIQEKLHHCQKTKTWWIWRVILLMAKHKLHAHHKTHLHTTKVYNTQSYRLLFLTTEVSTCSKSNQCFKAIEFVDWLVWKSLTPFALIFLSFLHKTYAWCSDMSRFLSPVSTISTRNTWDYNPLLAHAQEKKRNACIFRVVLLKQIRLIRP